MELELPIEDVVLQFTLVLTAAMIVEIAFERSRIPGLVGLLILGMLIGPGGLAVLPDGPVVELLGSIGLLYIMFLAGFEIDLEVVRHHKRQAVGFGLLAFVLSFVPAIAAGWMLGMSWPGAILLAAALSSHTLLAYPIVRRLGLAHRLPIVTTVGGTVLTDTLALILLAIVVQQPGGGNTNMLGWFSPILLLLVLSGVSLLVVPRLAHYLLHEAKATGAERAMFVLAVVLVLSAAADLGGTEAILGAFIAGICLNRSVGHGTAVREHLQFVGRMLFIPFFFVETGMRLELSVFAEQLHTWLVAGLLLVLVVVAKSSASWIAGHLFGYSRMDRLAMTGLALPQAAATLAVVLTGRELDLIGSEIVDAVIIVILLTCLLGPLITRFAGGRLQREDAE